MSTWYAQIENTANWLTRQKEVASGVAQNVCGKGRPSGVGLYCLKLPGYQWLQTNENIFQCTSLRQDKTYPFALCLLQGVAKHPAFGSGAKVWIVDSLTVGTRCSSGFDPVCVRGCTKAKKPSTPHSPPRQPSLPGSMQTPGPHCK